MRSSGSPTAVRPAVSGAERRLSVALWCAGLAAFSLMYAPQGLLTEIVRDTGLDASRVSLLVSASTLGLAASVLPWAWLSDRIGRRTAMRVAAAGATVTAVAVPWLPTFDALLAGRFLQGVALGGIPALAIALVHETAPAARTAAAAGRYVAATSLGGLSGRLVVVPLAQQLGWRWSLMALAAACAVLMIVMAAALPPSPHPSRRDDPGGSTLAHLRDPGMLALFAIGSTLIGGMVAVFNYLPFRLEAPPYALSPTVVSLIFFAYLGGTAGSRAAGRLTRRLGAVPVLTLGCLLLAGGAAATIAAPLPVVAFGVVALTAGLFLGHAVATHLVAARADRGRAQAGALYNISYYAGSSVFGWLGGLMWLSAGWVGVAAMVVGLGTVALWLTLRVRAT
ncbi:MFS transporter [Mycobacterium sp. GA-2829]|uniref:MFS transporter n=1 Tax=Mycobacterium sp. GA-2829 TaxID=1772283 RepID=UPI0007403723|nr:MFS transporter [Mycobacterium sp. GA-2829]KUI26689.1 MFS transporter [Mycobacterium sp. GA-2829]